MKRTKQEERELQEYILRVNGLHPDFYPPVPPRQRWKEILGNEFIQAVLIVIAVCIYAAIFG